jgi:hypothetical protein
MKSRHHATRYLLSAVLAGTAIIVSATASRGVRAQAPAAPANSSKTVTMTGCVERADQFTSSGTPSPVSTTVDSQSYVLIKVEPPPATGDTTAAGTSGTVSTGSSVAKASAAIGNMYKLDGDRKAIGSQVGHKVEVVGTLDSSSAEARPPDPQNPSAATSPVFVVTSIKKIAELCPR